MRKENAIIVLGEDTPDDVISEVREMLRKTLCASLSFSWDNEDNESFPKLSEYLRTKYNLYKCTVVL